MRLVEIPLPADPGAGDALLPAVEALVAEAERRIEAFLDDTDDPPLAFVPSDFRAVHAGLAWLTRQRLAPGRTFLEWGSGFGVVALMAAALGWEATGIELVPALVDEARRLAADLGLQAEFVEGSFVPEGARLADDVDLELNWLEEAAAPAYEELGLDTSDFDLVFAYPWPGESHVILRLFAEYAARGALLLTWNGQEGLRLHRLGG